MRDLDFNSPEYGTPLMKQWVRLKEEAGDAILFFRMGDFYELFSLDAVKAAPILGITLTSRDKKSENPVPMAGLPYHSATQYIQKVLNAGKKVAIAEQIVPEGMSIDQIKGIVDRQIVRTFTPAVQFELSGDTKAKYLATLSEGTNKTFILALLDPSTGAVRISEELREENLVSELSLHPIFHFLNASSKVPASALQYLESKSEILIEEISPNYVTSETAPSFLETQYLKKALHPLLERSAASRALAILVKYVIKTQGLEILSHLQEPNSLHASNRLEVGPHTHDHLDTNDLFELINRTKTSMGSRLCRQELEAPLKDNPEIEARQKSVQELAGASLESGAVHETLGEVYDLDRILGRVATKLANPRDTYALGKSIHASFSILAKLDRFQSADLTSIRSSLSRIAPELQKMADRILRTQKSDAPTHTRDGGIFELGTNTDLDHWIKLTTEGEKFLVELETREREQSGIGSLKVKYNRVFGYFIEISSANLKNVPAHYQRKQTMVGGERFFTEELKKFEEEILVAAQKQRALESKLFDELISDLIALSTPLQTLSHEIASLDLLLTLSRLVSLPGWCFPKIDGSEKFQLVHSRHPVVDQALRGEFVANDIELSPETSRTLIITGPNMGGKSTFMRQLAQIILLGQMGAPVPAESAEWGVFHSIFTRIGAHDAIARGQSTFMVEMVELAHILNHADSRSFVILDEIGRGTSTFDGMSVASASLQYLHEKAKARVVFATHYHELTDLETKLPGLRNAYMKVLDQKGKLTFLYEIALGKSSKSFGIQVAELAGLPKPVIKKSWDILKDLESKSLDSQLSLFSTPVSDQEEPVIADRPLADAAPGLTLDPKRLESATRIYEQLKALDVNQLRPIDALNALADLQKNFL